MNERNSMKPLEGSHILTGLDRFNETRVCDFYGKQDVEVFRFILDGNVWEIVENPSDGYRSGHYGPTEVKAELKNTFNGIRVVCQHVETIVNNVGSGEADILRIINTSTGKTILDIGTQEMFIYYPLWVCNFNAENIGTTD